MMAICHIKVLGYWSAVEANFQIYERMLWWHQQNGWAYCKNLQLKTMFFRLKENFSSWILAMEYLRNCHRQVFRLCRADFKIACCVWVVMFVKQYTGLQEMLCDQYWNKFNIMQPVLVLVIETSFFSKITWLQRQWIDSLLKGLGASSYTVLSLCMIYCDFFQNFY